LVRRDPPTEFRQLSRKFFRETAYARSPIASWPGSA
jgi:hypothetical protein